MERMRYDYETFVVDIRKLADTIDEKFDAIVAIARGGMTMAHMLGEYWDIRKVFVINAIGYDDTQKLGQPNIFNIPDLSTCQNILIVDDIADSGDTLVAVIEAFQTHYPTHNFKTATLFYKPTAKFQPDYKLNRADQWIDFFWSEDMKCYNVSTTESKACYGSND
ncbi:MAG: phosphoribosyltransferase [Hydrogenimonas sp.]|nr:MAG: phosphoribosyltransferase [Hydrogenimonas sp.]